MKKLLIIVILIFTCQELQAKTIIDTENRKVVIPEKISKVIASGPGALRFIAYMKVTEKLCGVENIEYKLQQNFFRPYWYAVKDKIRKLPVIGEGGPGKMPYFERIILTKPDIIIAVGFTKRQVDLIEEKTKTPVVLVNYGSLGNLNGKFENSIKILGRIFNKKQRSKELLAYFNLLKKDLEKRTANIKNVKKVYVGGVAYKGLHDITSTDTNFYPLKLINVVNIADKFYRIKGHVFVSWENLIVSNPDYIFIDKTSLPLVLENYKKNPEKYRLIKAVKEKRVYSVFPYNYYNTNVELTFLISYCIGKIIYPENFANVNLKSKAKEIFKKFLGVNIRLPDDFCNKNSKELLWN